MARLQFVTSVSGLPGVDGAVLWPTIVCQTRGISESGLALLVHPPREVDRNIFGVKCTVRTTVGLPTGVVVMRTVTERYARNELGVRRVGGRDEGGVWPVHGLAPEVGEYAASCPCEVTGEEALHTGSAGRVSERHAPN